MSQSTPINSPVVLALDLSIVRTGFAIHDADGLTSGVQSFSATGREHPAIRFRKFSLWLEVLLEMHRPDMVIFEALACRDQGGSQDALIGIKTRMDELCAVRAIPTASVPPASLKKAFVGDAKKDKGKVRMKARAAELWPDYDPAKDKGGDEADARALTWAYERREALRLFEFMPPTAKQVKTALRREAKAAEKAALRATRAAERAARTPAKRTKAGKEGS